MEIDERFLKKWKEVYVKMLSVARERVVAELSRYIIFLKESPHKAGYTYFALLFCVFYCSCFPYYVDLDLAGVFQFAFYLP